MEGVWKCGAKESIITCEGRKKKKILTECFLLSFIICTLDQYFGMTWLRIITWTGHVTCMGKGKCIHFGIRERKGPFQTPGHRFLLCDFYWVAAGHFELGNELLSSITFREFPEHSYLLKKALVWDLTKAVASLVVMTMVTAAVALIRMIRIAVIMLVNC
jgi:hypothetical protein